jgi:hypothetical protein
MPAAFAARTSRSAVCFNVPDQIWFVLCINKNNASDCDAVFDKDMVKE